MKNEERFEALLTDENFIGECNKKFDEQLEESNTVTIGDILESRGFYAFNRESTPDFELEPSKKAGKTKKPVYKVYENLAYISSMEATRCHMLIDKLKATIDLLNAQNQYYEVMSNIERENEMFGFDLNI